MRRLLSTGKFLSFVLIMTAVLAVAMCAIPSKAVSARQIAIDKDLSRLKAPLLAQSTESPAPSNTEPSATPDAASPTPGDVSSPAASPSMEKTVDAGTAAQAEVDLKKVLTPIAPVIACLVLILIVTLVAVKSKQKPRCKRCGVSVIPGRIYCESCSNPQIIINAPRPDKAIPEPAERMPSEIQKKLRSGTQESFSSGSRERVSTLEQEKGGREKAAREKGGREKVGRERTAAPTPMRTGGVESAKSASDRGMTTKEIKTITAQAARESAAAEAAAREKQAVKKARPSGRVLAVVSIRKGANQGYRFNIYESNTQIYIGKDPSSDIVIAEDTDVSNVHAKIQIAEDTGFLIQVMDNTTGLFVNNERVTASGLKSGDVIRVGKTELTFARL